jgi:cell division protein ZapA
VSISCRILVLGREIPVRTTASPDLVQKIETMVNERLALAATSMSLPNEQMVAILAMLNMAEEIVSLREQVPSADQYTERLEKLLDKVSAQVVAGSR